MYTHACMVSLAEQFITTDSTLIRVTFTMQYYNIVVEM